MYYVIKKQKNVPLKCFIGFGVPKYISSSKTENVIFEFKKDGKSIRKWVAKDEIVLLTKDKELFLKTMKRLQNTEEAQQKMVDEARQKLDDTIKEFNQVMNQELKEIQNQFRG